ncbi:MAG: DNA alkylation repair protein [Lachnospiraceae bacterium]|nr:DNA alkylation repair protein [Lachnospiraceae bacterium]
MSVNEEIRKFLFENADEKYRDFQAGLTPSVDALDFIGIRTPVLRKYAKELAKREDIDEFLSSLPHKFFDENQLHAFIISEEKDYDECIKKLNAFLPYVDNWATCDQMIPKVFKKHKEELLTSIDNWLNSTNTYSIRFGIKMLMDHFLNEDYKKKYMTRVSKIRSDEYYINMMIAWYFATALAKQYEDAITFIKDCKLDPWVHNKTISKAIESYRVTDEHKEYLRTLRLVKRDK